MMKPLGRWATTCALAATVGIVGGITTEPNALAAPPAVPSQSTASGAHITKTQSITAQHKVIWVYSPSMHRSIRNDVFLPRTTRPVPAVIFLNGWDGGAEKTWANSTPLASFLANKNVIGVVPITTRGSMDTNWIHNDPNIGPQKWGTYLSTELPEALKKSYNYNGKTGVVGLSMAGGPALDLAIQYPSRFQSAASISGCPASNEPIMNLGVLAMVAGSGGNPANMWGPVFGPGWNAHDPSRNAAKLRGKGIYLSAGEGILDKANKQNSVDFGGPAALESITMQCTMKMDGALKAAGVPHTFVRLPAGAHDWGFFYRELERAWPVIAGPIGA